MTAENSTCMIVQNKHAHRGKCLQNLFTFNQLFSKVLIFN